MTTILQHLKDRQDELDEKFNQLRSAKETPITSTPIQNWTNNVQTTNTTESQQDKSTSAMRYSQSAPSASATRNFPSRPTSAARNFPIRPTKSIAIASDSHGRGLAEGMRAISNKDVTGTVQPSAPLKKVSECVKSELQRNDTVVVIGGTNDDDRSTFMEGVRELEGLAAPDKKIVVVGVPNRYDTYDQDEAISSKNKTLREMCSRNGYVYVNVEHAQRYLFTRHGLHLNNKGKQWLCRQILRSIDASSNIRNTFLEPQRRPRRSY